MKILINIFFVILTLSVNVLSQTEFKISFNLGYTDGAKPLYTQIEPSQALLLSKASQLFKEIKSESEIEFDYSYGGCEDRAHAVSLLLKEKGIKHSKIWNFDPYYISLFNAQEPPHIYDRTKLNEKVEWGFHVAVILPVKDSDQVKSLVFDPAVADKLLTIKQWLEIQNSPNSYYTFTDSQWFSFYTINDRKYNNVSIPASFPTLLTGDFIMNEKENLINMWVEEGLAVNKVGMQIINEVINKEPKDSKKILILKPVVGNVYALTCFLRNECKDEKVSAKYNEAASEALKQYPDDARTYQENFVKIRSFWKTRLDKIRDTNL